MSTQTHEINPAKFYNEGLGGALSGVLKALEYLAPHCDIENQLQTDCPREAKGKKTFPCLATVCAFAASNQTCAPRNGSGRTCSDRAGVPLTRTDCLASEVFPLFFDYGDDDFLRKLRATMDLLRHSAFYRKEYTAEVETWFEELKKTSKASCERFLEST